MYLSSAEVTRYATQICVRLECTIQFTFEWNNHHSEQKNLKNIKISVHDFSAFFLSLANSPTYQNKHHCYIQKYNEIALVTGGQTNLLKILSLRRFIIRFTGAPHFIHHKQVVRVTFIICGFVMLQPPSAHSQEICCFSRGYMLYILVGWDLDLKNSLFAVVKKTGFRRIVELSFSHRNLQ